MPFNADLAARVERYITQKRHPLETKAMMGGLVFMVNGKMCVGVEKERLMVRLDPADETEVLALPGCKRMDFTGKPMRGYVFVDASALTLDHKLREWLDRALAFNPKAVASKRSKRTPSRQ